MRKQLKKLCAKSSRISYRGGITLTIFELLTASFAADDFNLRDDWERCRKAIRGRNTDILYGVDEVSFLTAVTLYTTYMKIGTATACGKPDVLALALNDYKQSRDSLLKGYNRARMFLYQQGIFRQRDIPYPAQIVPLAAICAVLDDRQFNNAETTTILSKWFWCGIFGEDYNNTNYVNDIEDVLNSINHRPSQNRTVNAALFNPARLLTMRTRQSAAYKGIMALLYKTRMHGSRQRNDNGCCKKYAACAGYSSYLTQQILQNNALS